MTTYGTLDFIPFRVGTGHPLPPTIVVHADEELVELERDA